MSLLDDVKMLVMPLIREVSIAPFELFVAVLLVLLNARLPLR